MRESLLPVDFWRELFQGITQIFTTQASYNKRGFLFVSKAFLLHLKQTLSWTQPPWSVMIVRFSVLFAVDFLSFCCLYGSWNASFLVSAENGSTMSRGNLFSKVSCTFGFGNCGAIFRTIFPFGFVVSGSSPCQTSFASMLWRYGVGGFCPKHEHDCLWIAYSNKTQSSRSSLGCLIIAEKIDGMIKGFGQESSGQFISNTLQEEKNEQANSGTTSRCFFFYTDHKMVGWHRDFEHKTKWKQKKLKNDGRNESVSCIWGRKRDFFHHTFHSMLQQRTWCFYMPFILCSCPQ